MKRRPIACLPSTVFLLALLISLSLPTAALAAGAEQTGGQGEGRARNIETLHQDLQKRDQVINDLLQRVQALEQEVRSLRGSPPPKAVQSSESPGERQPPVKQADVTVEQRAAAPVQTAAAPPKEEREEEERLAQATLERVLIQRSAVLLPAWTLEIEPSFTYAHSSADRVIIDGVAILDLLGVGIVVGDIVSERIRRDSYISALTGRLGLPWDFQVEGRFPYRYESEQVLTADFAERTRSAHGLGDLEFALSRQILKEKGWLPDIVGGFRWRTPTGDSSPDDLILGTGFHGLQATLSGVKVRDPVAFFGGGSYTANIQDTRDGVPIDPGDTWGFNLGMALALNPETSINFQWDHRFANHTTAFGENVPGSSLTVGTFRVGFTYAVTRDIFVDVGVGIGITQDAPDVQATIAVPIRMPRIFSQPAP
jgi:hypothetical protein